MRRFGEGVMPYRDEDENCEKVRLALQSVVRCALRR